MRARHRLTRRTFLARTLAGATIAPLIATERIWGANDRIVMAGIGMGGQGRGDLGGFLSFKQVHVSAVCDVVAAHRTQAKAMVDRAYGGSDCSQYDHFQEVLGRSDVDAVLIATPDHWHAVIATEAMKQGKDVYCEKPESLTVREGRIMVQVARRIVGFSPGGASGSGVITIGFTAWCAGEPLGMSERHG